MKLPLFVLSLLLFSGAIANDGWVGYTGAPRIEGKHPTIRMVDEVIHIRIGKTEMTADCRFTFKNEGNATSARIGFPDHNSNAEAFDKAKSVYKSFVSYVDGKRVPTRFVTTSNPYNWQVKTVRFEKGQTRKVRNVYRVQLGLYTLSGSLSGRPPMRHTADYIVSTGRTWKGNISSTRVIFEFEKTSTARAPITLAKDNHNDKRYGESSFWAKNRGLVLWSGFAKPRVEGRKVIFERKNWEPKDDDDVSINFGLFPRAKD